MTKKRLLVLLGVIAVGMAAGPLLYLFSLPKTQFRANYNRVHRGMTVEEVHQIMGGSGITYFSNESVQGELYVDLADFKTGNCETVIVSFTNGRLTWKTFRWNSRIANGLEEIRERLGF